MNAPIDIPQISQPPSAQQISLFGDVPFSANSGNGAGYYLSNPACLLSTEEKIAPHELETPIRRDGVERGRASGPKCFGNCDF